MGLKRCFIAVPLPSYIRQRLADIQQLLRESMLRGDMGRGSEQQIALIKDQLVEEAKQYSAFPLTVAGLTLGRIKKNITF